MVVSFQKKKKKRAYGRRLISRHLLTAENIPFIRKFLKIDVLKCVWVMIHFTERVFQTSNIQKTALELWEFIFVLKSKLKLVLFEFGSY